MKKLIFFLLFSFVSVLAQAEDGYRDANDVMVVVSPLNLLGPYLSLSRGAEIGYILSDDDIISIEFQSINNLISGDNHDRWESTSVGAHYRRFFTKSFNVKAGIDVRDFEVWNIHANHTSTASLARKTGRSTTAMIAVGNQWQLKHFTIGCDWLGYYTPLSTTLTQDDPRVTGLGEQSTVEIARFYLGVAF